MLIRSRSQFMPLVVVLVLGATPLTGCRKDEPKQAESSVDVGAMKKSLEGLKAPLDSLNAKFKDLHKQYDPLPAHLPGFGDVRAKFYAADEGIGRMSAKLAWLSDRLDTAVKAGNSEELKQVKKDIDETYEDVRRIDKLALELAHDIVPFQKMVGGSPGDDSAEALPFARALPSGYEVRGMQDGFEQRLLAFMEDPDKKIDSTTWFDFDGLVFMGDGSALDSERSKRQLENVAQLLKAYPTLKLKLAGYAAQSGAVAAAEKKRAAERAIAVKNELVRMTVDESRLVTEAAPVKHLACAPKESDECKTKSGRVAARVSAK